MISSCCSLSQSALSLVLLSHLLVFKILSLFEDLIVKSLGFKLFVVLVHHLLDLVAPVRLRLKEVIQLFLTDTICSKPAVCVERMLIDDRKPFLRHFLIS